QDVSIADSLASETYRRVNAMDYPQGLAACLILMSEIKVRTGDLNTGFDYGFRAIRISEQIKDLQLASEAYSQLYLLYFQEGDYDTAAIAAEKSMAIAEAIHHKTMLGRGHQNLGILNSIKGHHSKAIEHFLLSEKYYQELNDTFALALLVGNLGVTFEESG